ncbi:cytochrome c biogenesis protein CcdA [Pseudanabaena sp. FACHB-1998]|uniref:cytochrome c biogenesis CcdA family protein n=1 Tax=Pseudanabaena sp. FACHB-1998 TaxID=2692858 RepID=UPI001680BDF9|nr:cytochrome c biogenesis CcdA family protein [Pseudanabaena sp. FACHB-1998]MBD2176987.1 cytochrome c biogenesis protein CcdA [Pseudanabaena sp. FACHB-1998]
MELSPFAIGLAILGGMVTVFSPCILPILPIVIGRSLQTHRYGPIALVAGTMSGFAIAGSLLGVASLWFTDLANFIRILAIAILLILGLLSLFPKLNYLLLSKLRLPKFKEPERINLAGEFLLGSQLGLLWTPCAGSVLGSILVLAAAEQEIFSAFILLIFYGFGAGIPMLLIAYASRYFSKSFIKLRKHSAILQQIGGLLISLTAIAIILGWDVKVQLWLAPLFPPLFDL